MQVRERVPGTNLIAAHFSVSDIARLCLISLQEEEAQSALVASGLNLSRAELDAGIRRDHF